MMVPAVPIVLGVLLVVEVWVLVTVGTAVGALPTIGLLALGLLVGGWLVRHEGARTWRAFVAAVAEGRPPHREVSDGVFIMLGGLLILFPGFVSDALGLLCLLPPSRLLLRRLLVWYLVGRRARGVGGVRLVRVRSQRTTVAQPEPGRTEPGQAEPFEIETRPPGPAHTAPAGPTSYPPTGAAPSGAGPTRGGSAGGGSAGTAGPPTEDGEPPGGQTAPSDRP